MFPEAPKLGATISPHRATIARRRDRAAFSLRLPRSRKRATERIQVYRLEGE